MSYIPPWLDPPPHYSPRRNGGRLGQILTTAALIALVGFLVALITAIVTAGGGQA